MLKLLTIIVRCELYPSSCYDSFFFFLSCFFKK